MYYDHFLSKYWTDYSNIDISKHTAKVYNILMKNYFLLPPIGKRIVPFIISGNWLENYADLKILRKYFEGMARRTMFDSGMETAVDNLLEYYEEFYKDFTDFFPDICTHFIT